MTTNLKIETPVCVQWLIRKNMPSILEIENESFEFPWLEADFIHCLRHRNCAGMVADCEGQIAGFMIYELHKSRIHLMSLAVRIEYRRQLVGSQLVAKLIEKLSYAHQNRIILEVRESNLPAQLFFRECGFRAVSVLRAYYSDTPEDAYMMQYRYKPERISIIPNEPEKERIIQYAD